MIAHFSERQTGSFDAFSHSSHIPRQCSRQATGQLDPMAVPADRRFVVKFQEERSNHPAIHLTGWHIAPETEQALPPYHPL
jgi:hypothetical protein